MINNLGTTGSGSHKLARLMLQRAIEVAQNAGDLEATRLAALTILKELGEHLPTHDLSATYDRAAELLSRSGNQEYKDRLLASSRRVLFLVGALPTPPTWKGFNFFDAVLRYEARLIERALRNRLKMIYHFRVNLLSMSRVITM